MSSETQEKQRNVLADNLITWLITLTSEEKITWEFKTLFNCYLAEKGNYVFCSTDEQSEGVLFDVAEKVGENDIETLVLSYRNDLHSERMWEFLKDKFPQV